MKEFEDYKSYRWFYTSSGKLVIGGKSAAQNDILLNKLISLKEKHIIMHTSSPGSPFAVILSDAKRVARKDLEECAIFTACFGKTWKSGKKNAIVDIFSSNQLHKNKGMSEGTWAVNGPIEKISVELSLVLTLQESVLRAVPGSSAKKKDILLRIMPGKSKKEEIITKLAVELDNKFSQSDILTALPAGGISISKIK